ncbi:MAG TPA: hypothetical protein DCY13_11170, partial [Verrucomicrobiales bacterium]|nr:hypothetical protein [Verrucomicrobiales bacterium]
GIAARWLGAAGDAQYEHFRVNSITTGDQENPRSVFLSDGSALVVWQGGDGITRNIFSRLIRPDGTFATTSDVQVNAGGQHLRSAPAVAALAGGGAVVVWESLGQDDPNNASGVRRRLPGIYARMVGADGQPTGSEFLVNQTVELGQRSPEVAVLANGNVVIGWVSEKISGSGELERVDNVRVMVRIFGADGSPLTGEIALTGGSDICANPVFAANESGGFTAAWSRLDRDDAEKSWDVIYGAYDSGAGAIGGQEPVNSFTYGDQYAPRLATAGSSQMIVWTSLGQDGSWEGVYGRLLDGQALVGDAFLVNTASVSRQFFPAVAAVGESGYLVAWSSFVGGAGGVDLLAQRYWQTVPMPSAPALVALSSYELLAAWAPLEGLEVDRYLVYVDGSSTAIETFDNFLKLDDLFPGSQHTVRLAFRLADGRISPLSAAAAGRTWGLDRKGGLPGGLPDGLPDDWQTLYFGAEPTGWPRPHVDSDLDGVSDQMEFFAGTDPTDPLSVMKLSIEQTAMGFRLDWRSVAGSVYQLQSSTDFGSWNNVGGRRFAPGNVDSVLLDGSQGLLYYRVLRIR